MLSGSRDKQVLVATTIKQKLEAKRQTKKDGDQIYTEESCSVVYVRNKGFGCDLDEPSFQEEAEGRTKLFGKLTDELHRLSSGEQQKKL